MEYKQLKSFIVLCEELNFTRAAKRLFISQQALSKSIANLEQELGVNLFARTSHGVAITDAGLDLRQQAYEYLACHERILAHMHTSAQPGKAIRIGYFSGMLQELPPHFFTSFIRRFPKLRFEFYSYPDNEHSRCARDYDCDLLMTTSPLASSLYERICFFESPIGVVLHKDHTLAERFELELADLYGQQLITINSESRSQVQLLECLRDRGLAVSATLSDADEEFIFDLLQMNYISFYAGKNSALPDGIVFRPLADFDIRWEFYIYKRRGAILPDAA